jgi:hypothetical protein
MGQTLPPTKPPSQNKPKTAIAGLRVRFELGARDGLRRVVLAMERNNKANGLITWVVQFQLFERKTRLEGWTQIADLRVELDTKQNTQAAAVAARGLTDEQAARAIGPAADDARAAKRGEIPVADAHDSVRGIVR